MARHGLILSQDGATSLRNVFKYLPGLRDAILRPKMIKNTKKQKTKHKFPYILIYSPLPELRVGGMGAALYYYRLPYYLGDQLSVDALFQKLAK